MANAHSTDLGQRFHSHRGQRSMRWRTLCAGVLSDVPIVAEVSAISVEHAIPRSTFGGEQDQEAETLKAQVTPKRSVSMPKPALHADAASGSTAVASTASAFQ